MIILTVILLLVMLVSAIGLDGLIKLLIVGPVVAICGSFAAICFALFIALIIAL